MEEGAVDFVAEDGDGLGFGVVCQCVNDGFGEDGACGVLRVAGEIVRYVDVVGDVVGTCLIMMSFVFGLTRDLSSSKSGSHLFSAFDFHSETSAPRLSGIE